MTTCHLLADFLADSNQLPRQPELHFLFDDDNALVLTVVNVERGVQSQLNN